MENFGQQQQQQFNPYQQQNPYGPPQQGFNPYGQQPWQGGGNSMGWVNQQMSRPPPQFQQASLPPPSSFAQHNPPAPISAPISAPANGTNASLADNGLFNPNETWYKHGGIVGLIGKK